MKAFCCIILFIFISESRGWKDFGKDSDTWPLSTECGGKLIGNGRIQTPNFPGVFPAKLHCVWQFDSGGISSLIRLSYRTFHLEKNCTSKVEILNVGSVEKVTLTHCGKIIPQPVVSFPKAKVTVTFTSGANPSAFGFEMHYETITCQIRTLYKQQGPGEFSSPFYPEQSPHNLRCEVGFDLKKSGATVQFRLPSLDLEYRNIEGQGCPDYIGIVDYNDNKMILNFTHYCGHDIKDWLFNPEGNRVTIMYSTNPSNSSSGFYAPYEVDICGGDITDKIEGVITSGYYPAFYQFYTKVCIYNIIGPKNSKILVKFRDFIMTANDIILNNYVSLESIDDDQNVVKNHGDFVGDNLPPDVASVTNKLRFTFKSNSLLPLTLFYAEYHVVYCDDTTYTTPSETITSPRYPENYIGGINCDWSIELSDRYAGIIIKFHSFRVGSKKGTQCNDDKVIIKESVNGDLRTIGEYCGYYKPMNVRSESNSLKIQFLSMTSMEHIGFNLTYLGIVNNNEITTTISGGYGGPTGFCKAYLPIICLDIKCIDCNKMQPDHFHLAACEDINTHLNEPFKRYTMMYFCDEFLMENNTNIWYHYGCDIADHIMNLCYSTDAGVIRVGKVSEDCAVCYYNQCE